MKLTNGKNVTRYYEKLLDAAHDDGVQVVRRGRGYDDYNLIDAGVRAGYLEARPTGPRGGRRWHLTDAGHDALAAADEEWARRNNTTMDKEYERAVQTLAELRAAG